MPGLEDLIYNVGGGQNQAESELQAFLAAQAAELGRRQTGQGLLDFIRETMRDPFSLPLALQQYNAFGGGTLAPAAGLAGSTASGNVGAQSPYGAIAQQLIEGLAEFTGGTPYSPGTGKPFTPDEMAYLRQGSMSPNPQEFFTNAQRYFNPGGVLTPEQEEYLANISPTTLMQSPGFVNPYTGFTAQTDETPLSPGAELIGTQPPVQQTQATTARAQPSAQTRGARPQVRGVLGSQPRRSAQRYLRTRFGQ